MPFESLVVASTNDPFGSLEAQANLAAAWGAELQSIGARGHINADSGLGNWPQGRNWLEKLAKTQI
jgi:predicted alpha/beta hydrolase family esterase